MKLFEIPMVVTSLMGLGFLMGLEASPARADFTFGTPTNLGPTVNSSADDQNAAISPDGLELYYSSMRPGGPGNCDLWVTTRATKEDDWRTPVNLGSTVNSSSWEYSPDLSADGLKLYFVSSRPGGCGGDDEWVTTRATVSSPWGTPANLGPTVNSSGYDGCPSISHDGLMLTFNSDRPGGYGGWDVWVATRATTNDAWGTPVNAGPVVNSSAREHCTDIWSDGLLLFFVSERSGGFGRTDLWMTRRPTTSDPWGPPVHFESPVNHSGLDHGPIASSDGSTFYFSSDRPGGSGGIDLWQMSITPVVDFNGDGKVDIKDLLRLIESWRKYDPSVDIGPTPLGDGVVDEKDLEVLMDSWGKQVQDGTLVAHWKLDEAEGMTASDSAGGHNGTVVGIAAWQPAGGTVGGALEFNGTTFVAADFVLNPGKAPFSVLAWVKGGGPGQTLVSQTGGVNWLTANAQGALTTELSKGGRSGVGLSSPVVITDGDWHRIAFTWDGVNRRLYVDGILAAEDVHDKLADSYGKLTLGSAKNMAPGTFWKGLIDDVRIYNRAVKSMSN